MRPGRWSSASWKREQTGAPRRSRLRSGVVLVAIELGVRVEEVFRPRIVVDVVTIDGFSRGQRLALCLALGFFGRAGNVERDRDFDFRMQRDRYIGDADCLDGLVEQDLVAVDR